jgi:hypothetical protein
MAAVYRGAGRGALVQRLWRARHRDPDCAQRTPAVLANPTSSLMTRRPGVAPATPRSSTAQPPPASTAVTRPRSLSSITTRPWQSKGSFLRPQGVRLQVDGTAKPIPPSPTRPTRRPRGSRVSRHSARRSSLESSRHPDVGVTEPTKSDRVPARCQAAWPALDNIRRVRKAPAAGAERGRPRRGVLAPGAISSRRPAGGHRFARHALCCHE